MKPPRKVRVLGTVWTVTQDKQEAEDNGEWGHCLDRTRTINLHPAGDQPTLIFHELLHAFEHAMNVNLDHDELQAIARFFAAVLADNPRLLEYVTHCVQGEEE